ncbi:Mu-like prophage major head subunit gpT family protein [Desulfovibrio aminophilus]|uniref:Mu-like prophage major head subunit gpT family protein n=1 Tax=Desulfovibrio aminophilus TaxID=81425 RepID=UPI0004000B0C|nr:Mu-like prophage major head subunit gpT family protein [Desulfovibrio aminophilus]
MIINQASLQGIYISFNTIFAAAFAGAKSMWPLVAMKAVSTGAVVDYKWLANFPAMREWVGERVVKDLSAFNYTITNKDFEATVEVDRDSIEDDQIGVYPPLIQGLAHSAAVHPDQLVFKLLKNGFTGVCYDGQYFFDTDHPVGDASVSNFGGGAGTPWYLLDLSQPIKPLILQRRKEPEFVAQDDPTSESVFKRKKFTYGVDDRKNAGYGLWQLAYGSKQTLDSDSFGAAYTAMMSLKNEEDDPLGIVPTHLVVPPTLIGAARKVIKNALTTGGASNEWANTVELLEVPWLA